MAKRKEEGRELVKGVQAVYIYHDTVDAVGDVAGASCSYFCA